MRIHHGGTPNLSPRLYVADAVLRLAWVEFVGLLPWTVFVTLTFDPANNGPVTATHAERQAAQWCNFVEWVIRRPVAWLIAVERNRNGNHHAHVLFADLHIDIGSCAECWRLGRGRVDIRPVSDSNGIILYASKEAASHGRISLSDTARRYRGQMNQTPSVRLYESANEHTSGTQRISVSI